MGFNKKTIKEYDIHGKKVLLRADYNVSVNDNGDILNDYRIQESLPTINYLLDQNCSIIICSHFGRPDGKVDKKYSLNKVAKKLEKLLGRDVLFVEDCIGEKVQQASKSLKNGEILMLENLRFYKEEENNNDEFAKKLAELAEVFVQDAFGVVHRAHASTEAVTKHIPSIAGLLLEKEVDTITNVMDNPDRPLMAIIGGAKIADKIEILNRFIDIADFVVVGGAMANTFLLAEGIDIAKSMADKDDVPLAKDIIEKARTKAKKNRFIFYLPQDGVVAKKVDKTATTRIVDWDAHVIEDIESYPKLPSKKSISIENDEMILDIGPVSGSFIAGGIQMVSTVIWNGTMGVTETPGLQGPIGPFAHGTEILINAMTGEHGNKPFTLVGGGDTSGYLEQKNLIDGFNHVSTGGGASLDLMSGKSLPGVECLWGKD